MTTIKKITRILGLPFCFLLWLIFLLAYLCEIILCLFDLEPEEILDIFPVGLIDFCKDYIEKGANAL